MKKFILLSFLITLTIFMYKNNTTVSNQLNQQQLLDKKYHNFESSHDDNYTKLMCALETKQPISEIKRLFDEGADVNAVQMEFLRLVKPTLKFAIERGDDQESVEIIRLLLDKGANLELQTYNRVPDEKTYGIMSLLHFAVIYSSPEIVQILIDAGADVNFVPSPSSGIHNARTPLETAKLLDRQKTAEILVIAGAKEKRDLLDSANQVLLDKISGALIAGAIGDAMGRVTEFSSVESIFRKYPNGIKEFDDFKSGDFWYDQKGNKIAPYTDDTRMAILVFDTMRKAKLDNLALNESMEILTRSFINDMENNPKGWAMPERAPGISTSKNVKKLSLIRNPRNADWWMAGGPNDGGSGSVMRSYPFGLVFHEDIEKAEKWAVANSKITHGAPISLAGSAAIAVGTAHALHQKSPTFVVQQMVVTARKYDEGTAQMIEKAIQYAQNREDPSKVLEEFQGWVAHEAAAAAAYIFLMEPNDIQKAIYMGVHTPGDSDTIASIAGALVAARNGLSNIPKEWVERVEDSEAIQDLASQFFT